MTGNLLHCTLERSAARLPEKEAIRHNGEALSYAAFLREARGASAALLGLGLV